MESSDSVEARMVVANRHAGEVKVAFVAKKKTSRAEQGVHKLEQIHTDVTSKESD